MKKLLAILCAVALVATCCAVSFTAFADDTTTEERFFYSFATKEEYEANKKFVNNAGTNISLAYDETEGALKAYPTTPGSGNHQVRFSPSQGATTVKVDEYPVVALKVKFNNTGNPAFGGINAGTNKNSRPSGNTSSSVYSNHYLAGVGKTGQWQLIIYDGTKKVWTATNTAGSTTYCGTWEGLIFMLTANNATTTANDYCFIEWAGMFKTIQEVYAYEDEMVTPYLYNFEDEAATNKLLNAQNKRVTSGANTTLSYDAERKALKIDAKDGATSAGQFQPIADSPFTTMATSYPVIAFKIKVNNTANKFNELFIGTEKDSRTVSGGNYNNSLGVISDTPTGTWQLVIVDGSKMAYDPTDSSTKTWFDGTYGNMIIKLMADSTTATADDIWWVQWFGAFATVEDAKAYDPDLNATPFFYNFEDEDDINKLVSKNFINVNGTDLSIGYSETEGSLQLSTKNGGSANHQFIINPATQTSISVSEYPVIAMKVKFKNTGNPVFQGLNAGTNKNYRAPGASTGSLYTCEYIYTDATYSNSNMSNTAVKDPDGDWQLIVFDGSQVVYNAETGTGKKEYYGYHIGTIFLMTKNSTNATVGLDDYYIKWAGVFPSVEAAYAACGDHEYDNACDANCNICNAERKVGDHKYDNACDVDCNICKAIREVGDHVYDNACDAECNICKEFRDIAGHYYEKDTAASSDAGYFTGGKLVKKCPNCNDVKETILPRITANPITYEYSYDAKTASLTINGTFSEALVLDMIATNGAKFALNYTVAGKNYKAENIPVAAVDEGVKIVIEGFNKARLGKVEFDLEISWDGDVAAAYTENAAEFNTASKGEVDVAAIITGDDKVAFDAFEEAIIAETEKEIGTTANTNEAFMNNSYKVNLAEGSAELKFSLTDELRKELSNRGGYEAAGRVVTFKVKIGENTYSATIEELRVHMTVKITGLSFTHMNSDISAWLEITYAEGGKNFDTKDNSVVYSSAEIIENAATVGNDIASAFKDLMN